MTKSILIVIATGIAMVGCKTSAPVEVHEELLERHIEARGGRAVLSSLQVVERIGTFTFHGIQPNPTGTYHTCLQYPDRVAIEVSAAPIQVHQILGDYGPLECDTGFQDCKPASEETAEVLSDTAQSANREELSTQFPDSSDVESIVRDERVVGYKFLKEGRLVGAEFSSETGLETIVYSGERERRYGNWEQIDAMLLPMQLEDFESGTKTVTIRLHTATHTAQPSQWCRDRFTVKPAERAQQ